MDVQAPNNPELVAIPVAAVCGSTPNRRRLAVAVIAFAVVALLPAFLWLAPPSHFDQWGLLLGLWGLAGCTILGELALKQSVPVRFHALAVIGVLVLLVGGPVPALIAWLVPDLADRLLRDRPHRMFTAGFAANIASYGWCVLAAAGVLALTGADSISPSVAPSVLAVGLTLELVNFAIARCLYGTLYQGYRLVALVRDEFLSVLGAELVMLLFATVCALLIAPLGILVLALVGPAVLIPEIALPLLARSRDIAVMDRAAATRLYVAALATQLGIRGRERRVALLAADLLRDPTAIPYNVDIPVAREAQIAAWHASERWDGGGIPAGFSGSLIPRTSRLLAVAEAWSELTAAGGPQLPQTEALLALELHSASRLDPRIVVAAGQIVTTEAAFAELATFQPKLHTVALPRLVRSRALPAVLAAYRAA
jgi:HD domain